MKAELLLLPLLMWLFMACDKSKGEGMESYFRDWEEIIASDTLRVGTTTSPQDFYIYRGEMVGREYQKALDFATAHDLVLDVHIERSTDSLLILLERGEIDLCITPLPLTRTNVERYAFGGIIDTASLVLVQKREGDMVTNISELAGKRVWTDNGSASHIRLHQLEEEIGGDIDIMVSDTLSIEELMVMMPHIDSLEYLICDDHLGKLVSGYFPSLQADLRVSAPIKYGWALTMGNVSLQEELNHYFLTPDRVAHYNYLSNLNSALNRYISARAVSEKGVRLSQGVISPYDAIFKAEGSRLPWHWTLLAAIAYQESRFRSDVVGWSGARGLMGIMPITGRAYGASVPELLQPEVSVRVAVDCLLEVYTSFEYISDPHHRLCFSLASYNAGLGHVQDAMRLARKYNAPDSVWEGGVRDYVLLKSNPEYYNDEVVRFGYLRGKETVAYVDEIVSRGKMYHRLLEKK